MSVRSVIAVVLLLLVAGCGGKEPVVGDVQIHDPDGLHGSVLPEPYQLPAATLTDSHGQPFELRQGVTRPLTLVFFGYTHCPDICIVVMANIASAIERLPEADRDKIGVLFITSDPARDDPRTLRDYLDHINPGFEGLTGPLPDIITVASALGVAIEKGDKLPSGGYAVAHGTQFLGVLPDGSAPLVWTDGKSPKQIAEDLEHVLDHGVPKVKA